MNPAIDVLAIAIAAILAGCLGLLTEDFADHYGVTPWGLPARSWVVIVGFVALLAVVDPSRAGVAVRLGFAVLGLWMLARVTTWSGVVAERDARLLDAGQRPLRAAWLPDPTLRHERRYFDGAEWTDWVFDRGVQARDPIGVARSG
ncbi:MAG TPA: DUF2510 domain-containing protein [Acidimicrobiales bacterium]|nr:DUF2510 domain-containing protein [Acidimicrobiales bacterium]